MSYFDENDNKRVEIPSEPIREKADNAVENGSLDEDQANALTEMMIIKLDLEALSADDIAVKQSTDAAYFYSSQEVIIDMLDEAELPEFNSAIRLRVIEMEDHTAEELDTFRHQFVEDLNEYFTMIDEEYGTGFMTE